jgi:hypothetical protein
LLTYLFAIGCDTPILEAFWPREIWKDAVDLPLYDPLLNGLRRLEYRLFEGSLEAWPDTYFPWIDPTLHTGLARGLSTRFRWVFGIVVARAVVKRDNDSLCLSGHFVTTIQHLFRLTARLGFPGQQLQEELLKMLSDAGLRDLTDVLTNFLANEPIRMWECR